MSNSSFLYLSTSGHCLSNIKYSIYSFHNTISLNFLNVLNIYLEIDMGTDKGFMYMGNKKLNVKFHTILVIFSKFAFIEQFQRLNRS